MRTLALGLALFIALPLATATGPAASETYVAAGGGPASWAAACLEDANVGAACFPLAGWERAAHTWLDDDLSHFPTASWYALDADLLPLASGSACGRYAELPEGAAYFVLDFGPTSSFTPIPECQRAVAGTAYVTFGG